MKVLIRSVSQAPPPLQEFLCCAALLQSDQSRVTQRCCLSVPVSLRQLDRVSFSAGFLSTMSKHHRPFSARSVRQ
ncbi:hypothetical protein Q8A67_022100 [Cirrhinus molitorella]|uniref:Uncharacterized protein n=1 Tax=Cirrhinus molitorella TaxID=172907 RepID=A0AA88P5Y7_9TELE|nr:hypothetical protein Q8A67_022100 [Cirrhinus molitorella]